MAIRLGNQWDEPIWSSPGQAAHNELLAQIGQIRKPEKKPQYGDLGYMDFHYGDWEKWGED